MRIVAGAVYCLAAILVFGVPVRAQTSERLQFEAASVKPSDPQNRRVSFNLALGGRVSATNTTVRALIRFAYQVPDVQISGGPNWVNTESYDVIATPGANATPEQVQKMMQSLLAERFKLTFALETKSLKAYVIVVAKSGSKLRESTTAERDMTAARSAAGAPSQVPPQVAGDDNPPPDLSGTSIFTAMQEQLGLRLESRKEPTEIFTIQHAEKATEN